MDSMDLLHAFYKIEHALLVRGTIFNVFEGFKVCSVRELFLVLQGQVGDI